VFRKSPTVQGAPAGFVWTGDREDVKIYPLVDDAEYCVSGWHLVGLIVFDDLAFYDSHRELFASLQSVEVAFELDGQPLETEQTAIKPIPHPFPEFGFEHAFEFQTGAFLPPGTLSVGPHALRVIVIDPVFGDADFTVAFTGLPC
jgi:hypothetical protein